MRKYRMETVVGIFVVIGLLCVGYMAIKLGKVSLFEEDTYPLYARFTSVQGLKVDSRVEIFGIPVGRVERLSLDPQKEMALVRLDIRKGVKIYDDGSASIKTAGLIGDKYIKIDPGGAGKVLQPGATITETMSAVDIEELIGNLVFGQVKKGSQEKTEPNK